MASRQNPHRVALEAAVDARDLDGVLFDLTQIAVDKRDDADQPGGNRAERKYWQEALEILQRCQTELETLGARR